MGGETLAENQEVSTLELLIGSRPYASQGDEDQEVARSNPPVCAPVVTLLMVEYVFFNHHYTC